jgi:hypothetical protein
MTSVRLLVVTIVIALAACTSQLSSCTSFCIQKGGQPVVAAAAGRFPARPGTMVRTHKQFCGEGSAERAGAGGIIIIDK